jgi:hypothetical protein
MFRGESRKSARTWLMGVLVEDGKMFNIGDKVKWESQASGITTTKRGEVAAIVPSGYDPRRIEFLKRNGLENLSRRFDGWPRNEKSYLVTVRGGKTERSSFVVYWPRANSLKIDD